LINLFRPSVPLPVLFNDTECVTDLDIRNKMIALSWTFVFDLSFVHTHWTMFIIQKVLNFFFLNRAQCFLDTVWDCTKVSLQKIKPHLVTPMYFVIVTPITYYFWVILRQMEQYRKLVLAQNQTTRTGTSVLWRSRNLFSQIWVTF